MKKLGGVVTSDDIGNRKCHRLSLNELWVTDITEHRTREVKVFCCCVMDTFSRKNVGWSIDAVQNSNLVVNALDMVPKNREAGLMPSFGSIGDGLDNAMMEWFWSSMQIELLHRKRWSTRVELANAMFEYIEVFHNSKRRHSGPLIALR